MQEYEKLSIFNIEKEALPGKGELIYWTGRNKDKKKRTIISYGHNPYFYTTSKLYKDTIKELLSNERVLKIEKTDKKTKKRFKTYNGKNAYKINTKNSIDVSGIKDKFEGIRDYFNKEECWEDTIPYIDRVPLDINIKNGIIIPANKQKIHYSLIKPCDFFVPLRKLFIDIETLTEKGNKFPDPQKARQSIILISCMDSYKKVITTFLFKKNFKLNTSSKSSKIILKTPINSKYKWEVIIHNNEFEMFNSFMDYYTYLNCDSICAWNGHKFDFPYIINRIKILDSRNNRKKIDYKRLSPMGSVWFNDRTGKYTIKGKLLIDTQEAYLHRQTKTTSGALTNAGTNILGYGKIKLNNPFNVVYEKNLKKLTYYNAIDTIIDYEIYIKMRQEEFYSGIRRFIGVSYNNIFSNLKIIETMIMFKAKQKNIILPSARSRIKKGYPGAYVAEPTQYGRITDICTLDFKSLYPGIMICFNIGFDTYIGYNLTKKELNELPYDYIKTPANTYFRKDKQSIIVECLIELINYRDDIKKTLFKLENKKNSDTFQTKGETILLEFEINLVNDTQTIIKYITNTMYGVFGNEHFILYNVFIAKTITIIGKNAILLSIKILAKLKRVNIYSDTDSVKFKLHSKTIKNQIKESEKVASILNKKYKEYYTKKYNVPNTDYLIMRPEKISKTYFITRLKGSESKGAKKKYSESVIVKFELNKPIILKEPIIEITGHIRSNYSTIGNKIFKETTILLHQDKTNNIIKKEIIKFIKSEIDIIKSNKHKINDICMRMNAKKEFNEYTRETKDGKIVKRKIEHIDAGRWTNEWAHKWNGSSNLGKGSTIYYIYVDEDNIPSKYSRTDKVALDDNFIIPKEIINLIDYNRLILKTILSPLKPTLKELNINISDITYDGYNMSLI